MDLIDCDISNERTERATMPVAGAGYLRPKAADGSAASDAYIKSAQKSADARKGIPADGRPSTDSLYFGKV
jgi:hypothetical protein